ncbi:MAG: type II toxin-antitoxin system VapC family toxin [Gammaproteobacteria bacterium]|nr:type II toxin-antitoxin system VapC family toxin [Gammaproteobacteria bacterium]NNJ84417.1 type II toxin-antitoxin system VapC family toxin [Gammaproteobacteria bacterium]
MKYLLDTCVLSELVKPVPNPEVLAWVDSRAENDLFVAAMTLAELQRGVARLPSSRRKNELSAWLENLQAGFGERVLPFTGESAACWGEMCARADAAGKTIAAFDSIIAATALEHGLALVTRNVRDFSAASLMLVNPWEKLQ